MSWPAKMDLTPQRGAFSRVLNRLARNTKIVFSPQRGGFSWALVCTIILQIPFVCVTGAALENPVRPSKRLKRGRRSAWEPCTAILKVEARQVQRLRTPCGHRKGWSAAGAALENPVRPSFLAWPPQGPTTNWTPATPLSMLRVCWCYCN